MLSLIALLTTAAAIGGCFYSWRQQQRSLPAIMLGGLLVLLALFLWCQVLGLEFGLSIGLFIPIILVWPFILSQLKRKPSRTKKQATQKITYKPKAILKYVGLFLLFVIGYGAISTLGAIALGRLLSDEISGQAAVATFTLPSFWAALSVYSLMETSHKRVAAVFTFLALGAGLYVL